MIVRPNPIIPPPARPFHVDDRFYRGSGGSGTGLTLHLFTANEMIATAFYVPKRNTYTSMRLDVAGAGAAGEDARLGIYTMGTDGVPDALVLDAGLVDVDAVAIVEKVISQALEWAWYWAVALSDSNTAKLQAMAKTSYDYAHHGATDAGETYAGWCHATQAFGALPSTFPTPVTWNSANIPDIVVKW